MEFIWRIPGKFIKSKKLEKPDLEKCRTKANLDPQQWQSGGQLSKELLWREREWDRSYLRQDSALTKKLWPRTLWQGIVPKDLLWTLQMPTELLVKDFVQNLPFVYNYFKTV